MTHQVREIDDSGRALWNALVESHPLGQGRVTTEARPWWKASSWSMHLIGAFRGDTLVGGAVICTKKIPLLPWWLGRIVALLPDPGDIAGSSSILLKACASLARRTRVVEIEARLPVMGIDDPDYSRFYEGISRTLVSDGYAERRPGDGTYLVRVDRNDADLLESMSAKCRRDVRKGQREGVTMVGMANARDFDLFCETHQAMKARKGLGEPSHSDYEKYRAMFEGDRVRLFSAQYQGRTCNMALLDTLGVPRYLLGAMTSAAYQKGTPPTGQLLHFEIMRRLRQEGARYYDLGGSPGPVPIRGHSNYDVWRFKHEFGGVFVRAMSSHSKLMSVVAGWVPAIARSLGRL